MRDDVGKRRAKLVNERRYRVYRLPAEYVLLLTLDRVLIPRHAPGTVPAPFDSILLTIFFHPLNGHVVLVVLHEDFQPQEYPVRDWDKCDVTGIDLHVLQMDGIGEILDRAKAESSAAPPAEPPAEEIREDPPEDPFGLLADLPYKDP